MATDERPQGPKPSGLNPDEIKEFTKKTREAGNRCDLRPFEGTDHYFMQNVDSNRVPDLMDEFLSSLGYIG